MDCICSTAYRVDLRADTVSCHRWQTEMFDVVMLFCCRWQRNERWSQ